MKIGEQMTKTLFITLLLWMPLPYYGFVLPGSSLQVSTIPRPLQLLTTKSTTNTNAIDKRRDITMMNSASSPPSVTSSLASSYAIRIQPSSISDGECKELKWDLHSLCEWERPNQGEGSLALRALSDCAQPDGRTNADVAFTLSCQWALSDYPSAPDNVDSWSIDVAIESVKDEDTMPRELLCVLSRIMVQSATLEIANKMTEQEALLRITLSLPDGEGCQVIFLSDIFPTQGGGSGDDQLTGVRRLFSPLNSQYANMEIVDMVNNEGQVLGSLPRPYIHTWNLLHRGIGMIVSKDVDIFEALQSEKIPDVYVHQRTSTKRIFPSLFDMFVGGVSSNGEDAKWTAAREVAEELGLKRALNVLENEEEVQAINPLSEKLFECIICTSYNRCVVSMFTYCCDTSLERITWQEEEVAWGDYVPYDMVKLAGDLSIDRLVKRGIWPGSYCNNEDSVRDADRTQLSEPTVEELKKKYGNNHSWDAWDFVPDGLLVWEAWKSFSSRKFNDNERR